MEKRILGKTSFEVSSVGIGGIPIQRVDKETALKLIEEAYNQGMNFIDTARGYRESEALIGYAVEKLGREKFIIATKSMERTYEGMKKDLHTSLELLRTDYIDLYQFHNVRTTDALESIMAEDGALKALKEAKEQGLIKEIGITSHSIDILNMAIDMGEFSAIQCPYNAVERQGEAVFEKAKLNNIGVIIMKPLAGGAISKGELSIRFVLSNPNITVAIPGMDSIEQIRENAIAGIDRRPMTKEEEEELFTEAQSLGSEFCRRCGYCLPCTEGIDIPSQFVLDSYYTRYNLQGWAIDRYKAMVKKAEHCIECGICETRCPYNLPITNMLKKVATHLG